MNSRIVILTGNHLCHNPRAFKEAATLAKAGYDVVTLGSWYDPFLKERDQTLLDVAPFRFVPVVDTTESSVSRLSQRARSKIGALAHRIARINNRWQLGYAYPALRKAALRHGADLYIAHSEQAMATAADLLQAGRRVGVDMEDWFSEDLLPDARQGRPLRLLRSLESTLLTRGTYTACPSHAMSMALAEEFHSKPPAVIYNAFPWSERRTIDGALKDRGTRDVPSIHWFSQTLGPGRGLEDLMAALPLVEGVAEIHLRGHPAIGFETWLAARVPDCWRSRIFIHRLVANEELISRIAEHDIGFAGEMNYCPSRDLTVTNKILYYFLAGIAVVASNTTGQREVAAQAPGAVLLYPSGDSAALAAQLDLLLASPESLRRAKANALRAAELTFCWERQEKVLLNSVARAVASSPDIVKLDPMSSTILLGSRDGSKSPVESG
jgi:glycosyltransferase involved in cell wall biosynthesis